MTLDTPRPGELLPAAESSLQVLDRVFAVLARFTDERPEWSTTELARACALPTPTAHRILSSLRTHGFVEQHADTKRFALGHEAIRLGDCARASSGLQRRVAGPLRRLAVDTSATAVLTAVASTRDEAVCLHRSACDDAVLTHLRPGGRAPLHAGATHKALLAYMPEHEISRVLARGLRRVCRATITDPGVLRAHLAEIRSRGWAMSREETELRAWGVAVPICDGGEVVAALGVAGPVDSLSRTATANWLSRVRHSADEVASVLLAGRDARRPGSQGRGPVVRAA